MAVDGHLRFRQQRVHHALRGISRAVAQVVVLPLARVLRRLRQQSVDECLVEYLFHDCCYLLVTPKLPGSGGGLILSPHHAIHHIRVASGFASRLRSLATPRRDATPYALACFLYVLIFSPHHAVYHVGVALYQLHHFRAHAFIHVVRHGQAVVAALGHLHCGVDALQQRVLIDTGQDEAALVQRLGALGGGADAHRREGLADTGVERAFLRQRAAVADDGVGVHLQAVEVVEAQWLVGNHARVEHKAAAFQALAAARVAAVEDGHVVLLGHGVHRLEEREEVRIRIDILLAVGREQDVAALFQPQALMHRAGLDIGQVVVQHLGHGRAGHIGALRGHAAGVQVAAGVLRVAQVHIRDDVHDAAVRLLRQALVEAAVAGLHVEDGDVQSLGGDDGEAAVRIAQHQHGIRLQAHHLLVAGGDDVADGFAQVAAHGIHVDFRVGQFQVAEEHAVEVVVVVLPGVGQQAVEILAALVDDRRQADNLRPRAHDDEQLQPPVVLESCFCTHKIQKSKLNF